MSRLPLAMVGAGALIIILGCAVLAYTVTDYLDSPLAISSTAGLTVFENADGTLVSYDFFEPGVGPSIITIGGVFLFASLFLLALLWRGQRVTGR